MPKWQMSTLTKHTVKELFETALSLQKATVYIKNGSLFNTYTREIYPANVAIKGDRIAYVGMETDMIDPDTEVIDASGLILVPGYIEPHAHPSSVYNPIAFINQILEFGTTTVVADNLALYQLLSDEELVALMDEIRKFDIKMLWGTRLFPTSYIKENDMGKFSVNSIRNLMERDDVIEIAEITSWPYLLDGEDRHLVHVERAKKLGMRISGHAPGCSSRTLNALAAAGITSDHESITKNEVVERLRLGFHVMLRHSSLRPDLPELVKAILENRLPTEKIMMTTDGPNPSVLRKGFQDQLIRLAIDNGIKPEVAYQWVTINPATYLGLDEEIGSISPGRIADINFLSEFENPTPVRVMAKGKIQFMKEQNYKKNYFINWDQYNFSRIPSPSPMISADLFKVHANVTPYPVMNLVNAVITKLEYREDLTIINDEIDLTQEQDLMYISLIGRDLKWITKGIIKGLGSGIDGIACTHINTFDIVVCGRNHESMCQALNRVLEIGGGIVLLEINDIILEIPLELGGIMGLQDVPTLGIMFDQLFDLCQERGYPYHDIMYTLFFLTGDPLPFIRLTKDGLFNLKNKELLIPSEVL